MRRASNHGLGIGVVLVLAGCGAGTPASQTLSAATAHGLSYTLQISGDAKKQCTTETYRTALPDGQPVLQGSHSCGPPAPPGHPVLIQSANSPESMVVDVAKSGCGAVQGGSTPAALRPLATRCTTGKPQFRVAILPPLRRLVIVGIPGAPVINFPRHPCRMGICITPLA